MNSSDRFSLLETWVVQAGPRIKQAEDNAFLNPVGAAGNAAIQGVKNFGRGHEAAVKRYAFQPWHGAKDILEDYLPFRNVFGAPRDAALPLDPKYQGIRIRNEARAARGGAPTSVTVSPGGTTSSGSGGSSPGVAGTPGAPATGGGEGGSSGVETINADTNLGGGKAGPGFLDSLKSLAGRAGTAVNEGAGAVGRGIKEVGSQTAGLAKDIGNSSWAKPLGATVLGGAGLAGIYALARHQRRKGQEEEEESYA